MIDNPWFIGIVGSLVASIIFGLLLKLLGNKDYSLNIAKANSEIINLLIMSTAEGKLPNKGVIESLIKSIAKKYSVSVYDVYTVTDTYDDLMRNIYESNFIPHDKKQQISNQLNELKIEIENGKQKDKVERPFELFALRRTLFSYYTTVGLTMLVFLGVFKEKMGEITVENIMNLNKNDTYLFIAVINILVFFITTRVMERRLSNRMKKIVERKNGTKTNIKQPNIN
ncbi:hypothetical protein NYE67_10940 [Solibacillus sp. FSL W8-0474]|uniref:hypothetical protein n=1 Tax=Solibacillus sp. FSL W8-0474 TaxID=2975336 RepID=UPI0030F97035